MIMPLAAFLALILDQRANNSFGNISTKKAFVIGLITGLFAAIFGTVFELFITFVTRRNDIIGTFPELQRMIQNFPVTNDIRNEVISLFEKVRSDILSYGFSWFYTLSVLLNNFIVNTVFGMVGGLIGSKIINSRTNISQ